MRGLKKNIVSVIINFFGIKLMSKRPLLLIALAILALALYTAGIHTGAYLLFGLAVVVELWFWIKLIGNRNSKINRN